MAVWSIGASALFGHGGGLDGSGGHNDRKNGGYHFHRGSLAGKSYSSKTAAQNALRKQSSSKPPKSSAQPKGKSESGFKCEGKRTCGQMSTCAEAKFYLNQCGVSRLDGDKDGVPCESLCE